MLNFDEDVKFKEEALESINITNKIDFIKSLFVDNPNYNLLDEAMDSDNIQIVVTSNSIALTLNNNALKQTIMRYLDDPDFKVGGLPELTTGNKDGKYRMDAEINLANFTDLADNIVENTLDSFKIEFNVTVNDGTPNYESDVAAKFLTE